MTNFDEKRDFQRMAIDCVLSFSKAGQIEKFEGNVVNLSSKGILFTTTSSFEVGEELDIVLTPSNSLTPPMHASVQVGRVNDNDTVYELACEINNIQ